MPADPKERRCVLVVEDNDVNRLLVVEMLRRLGFDVKEAVDGLEAIELCRLAPPDAVLMDVHMPRMDGIAATAELRRLQRDGELAEFPIIGATADASCRTDCIAAGMTTFMTKPLEMARLRDDLNELTLPVDR